MLLDYGVEDKDNSYYYRLRMWIDEKYIVDGTNKIYAIKVNVYGK